MRRVCRAAIITLVVTTAVAGEMVVPVHGRAEDQNMSPSDYELLRSDIRTKKATLIAERMNFTDKEAAAFWPVYRQYEVELAGILDKKIALLKDYMSHHETMTDEQAKQLAENVFRVDQQTLDLRVKCFGTLEKSLSAKTVVRWLQLERRLQLYVDAQLAKELPAIKE
ncbi:MAG: exported protein of unknown function [Nitrospira sp.]